MTSGVQCQTSMTTIVTQAEIAVLGHVVVEAEPGQRGSEEPDVLAREDLPDRSDHIPRNEHRQRHHHQCKSDQPAACAACTERHRDAERHFDHEAGEREGEGAKQRVVESRANLGARVQEIAKPGVAIPEEIVCAHRVLDRIVHDRHRPE